MWLLTDVWAQSKDHTQQRNEPRKHRLCAFLLLLVLVDVDSLLFVLVDEEVLEDVLIDVEALLDVEH